MSLKKSLVFFYFTLLTSWAVAVESLDLAKTKVQTFEKKPVVLADKFSGKILLLDFWASWCGPCKESLPFYQDLQKRYGPQGLQVLALSVDEEVKDAHSFVNDHKLTLPFLWDEKATLAKSLTIHALPSTLLLDKKGQILYRERGFTKSSKRHMEEQISKLLKKTPPSLNDKAQ